MTPYYEQDGITIYHGDCLDVLPSVTADVLVTDPPYGIALNLSMDHRVGTDRTRARGVVGDEDTSLRDAVLDAWGTRAAVVFGSWKRARPQHTRMLLTWEKGMNCGMGDLSLPWKPNTEEIYVIGTGFSGHRGSSVLWHQAPVSQVSWGRVHPTQKPVSLMRDIIAKCPLGIVLDPFMGSGTTLVAAKKLGRRAIGIEIEERYCEIAANRLAQRVLPLETSA